MRYRNLHNDTDTVMTRNVLRNGEIITQYDTRVFCMAGLSAGSQSQKNVQNTTKYREKIWNKQ